jgi:hypothetical protein
MIVESVDIDDLETMQEIFRLRANVWSSLVNLPPEFFPQGRWTDGQDDHALHWAAKNAGEIVASA